MKVVSREGIEPYQRLFSIYLMAHDFGS
jgi:hypothetical protein